MDLPIECIEQILKFLSFDELKECRLVCKNFDFEIVRILKHKTSPILLHQAMHAKRWYELWVNTQHPCLLDSIFVFSVPKYRALQKVFFKSCGIFLRKLRIDFDSGVDREESYRQNICKSIHKTIGLHCPNLQELELSGPCVFSKHFPDLTPRNNKWIWPCSRIKQLKLSESIIFAFNDVSMWLLRSPYLEKILFLDSDFNNEIIKDFVLEFQTLEQVSKSFDCQNCKETNTKILTYDKSNEILRYETNFCRHFEYYKNFLW